MAIGFAIAGVLAHQGGWDEVLLVLTPVALFAALLWLANTRATRIQDERAAPTGPATDAPPTDDDAPTDGDPPTEDDATDEEATDADPGTELGT